MLVEVSEANEAGNCVLYAGAASLSLSEAPDASD